MLRLGDIIEIRNHDIKIEMGDEEEKYEKDFEQVLIPQTPIVYPSYGKRIIKCWYPIY